MLKRIREPFGKAGLVVAILALVAAMGGGAYAAKNGLTGKEKKEVKKIAKQYAGKRGKNGQNGQNGTNGLPGAKGDNGAPGAPGAAGAAGGNGKSVTVTPIALGTPGACEATGGVEVKQEGATTGADLCNGEEGLEGPEGSPWTAGGLPSGKTETGSWSFGKEPTENPTIYVPISFNVPLEAGKTVAVKVVNLLGEEEFESTASGPATICTGSAANPTAPAGTLCIYEQSASAGGSPPAPTARYERAFNPTGGSNIAGITGTNLVFKTTAVNAFARGDWAVTAP